MSQTETVLPISDLQVNYYLPSADLRQFIKYYWIVHINDAANQNFQAMISPSGFPELIFHFGDSVSIDQLENKKDKMPTALIGGQITQPVTVVFGGTLHCLCVKLQPHALKALFNVDSSVFTNNAFDLGVVNQQLRSDLFFQLTEAPNNNIRIAHIESFLRRLLKVSSHKVNSITVSMLNYFKNTTNVPLKGLEELSGCSSRTLQRKIKEDVGISPKMLYRIIRFNKAYYHIKHQQNINLQDVAFAHGYYDLSHFINEFREFTGQSPLVYFKDEKLINDFFAGIL